MSDRSMGLNVWAKKIVECDKVFLYTEETTRIYPDGHKEVVPPRSIYLPYNKESYGIGGDYDSLDYSSYESGSEDRNYSEDVGSLNEYTFSDGRVFFERVQAVHSKKTGWLSSDEFYFLALKEFNQENKSETWVSESLWTEEDMAKATAS